MLSFLVKISKPSSITFETLITIFLVICNRIKREEAMLKNYFGKEWDEYVKTRWKLIPNVT